MTRKDQYNSVVAKCQWKNWPHLNKIRGCQKIVQKSAILSKNLSPKMQNLMLKNAKYKKKLRKKLQFWALLISSVKNLRLSVFRNLQRLSENTNFLPCLFLQPTTPLDPYPRSEGDVSRCCIMLLGVLLALLAKSETNRRLLTVDCWSSSLSSPGLRFAGSLQTLQRSMTCHYINCDTHTSGSPT